MEHVSDFRVKISELFQNEGIQSKYLTYHGWSRYKFFCIVPETIFGRESGEPIIHVASRAQSESGPRPYAYAGVFFVTEPDINSKNIVSGF
jgi:hypothetical protein